MILGSTVGICKESTTLNTKILLAMIQTCGLDVQNSEEECMLKFRVTAQWSLAWLKDRSHRYMAGPVRMIMHKYFITVCLIVLYNGK